MYDSKYEQSNYLCCLWTSKERSRLTHSLSLSYVDNILETKTTAFDQKFEYYFGVG